MRTVAIASDHGGFSLKEKLKVYLEKKGVRVKDFGTYSSERCDYTQFAYALSEAVSRKKYKEGILICKSGIGNSIVANKLPGVRAALCYNLKAARLSREHNDSNILVLGALFSPADKAKKMVNVWLATPFAGGRHKKRVEQIAKIERKVRDNG